MIGWREEADRILGETSGMTFSLRNIYPVHTVGIQSMDMQRKTVSG
jgi:hypothetical protein